MSTTVAPPRPLYEPPAPAPVAPPPEEFVPGAPPPAPLWADTWRGIAMGVATTFVLVGSGLFVSLFRKYIAHEVRITSYILIIATFVTLADLILAATFPDISRALGPTRR